MRVLLVTPWPLATSGGGQRLAREIASALAAHHAVEVVVAAGSGLVKDPPPPMASALWREYRVLLDRDRLDGLDDLADAARPEAILFTSHYSGCARQAGALAARLKIPFLLWPSIHLDVRAHTSRDAQRFYRSASMVLCLSDLERFWLVRSGVAPDRAITAGYGWSGAPVPRPKPRRFPGSSSVRLLTVGAYVPHKQLDHQLEALAWLRHAHHVNAHLTLAGVVSNPSVFNGLARDLLRLGLSDCVERRTNCSDAEIADLHAGSDCFLFTSRSESFGVALIEAIGCGTVPVVYPHAVYRQPIDATGFGVVAARANPRALARAIAKALTGDAVDTSDRRRHWLAERSWDRVVAPIAETLRRPRLVRGACIYDFR